MKDAILSEKLKELAQVSECLDAISFIAANTELLSVKAVEILDGELAIRSKEDPLYDIFEHEKRLIETLRNLAEKLKPKILPDHPSSSVPN